MEKQINTRVLSKIDTQSNWDIATEFIPRKGEIIIYGVDSNHSYPRFKVGDGKTLVSALPFSTDILDSYVTETELASALNETTIAINKNIATIDDEVATHIATINNPHQVTKSQIGLSNVRNVDNTNATNLTTGIVPKARMNSAPGAYAMNPYVGPSDVARVNLGNPSLAEMALIDSEMENKIWFCDPTRLTFEQSTNGTSWEDISSSVSTKTRKSLVNGKGETGNTIRIPISLNSYRITIDAYEYCYLNYFYAYISTNGNTVSCMIEAHNPNNDTWETITPKTNEVSSWPGHLWIQHKYIPFYNSPDAKYRDKVRVTLSLTEGTSESRYEYIELYKIQWWGGYPIAANRHIYTWDSDKNVTFPAKVEATSIEAESVSINGANVALVSDVPDFGSPTANATTLAAGSSATASVTATGTNENMVYNFSFGIPRGNTGPTGPTGPQGERGLQGLQGPTGSVASVSQSGTGFVSSISLNSSTKVLDVTRTIIDDGEL